MLSNGYLRRVLNYNHPFKVAYAIDFLLEYFDLIDEEQLKLIGMKFNGKE